jgi:exopolyphosphatase / guanosine-5'-triphosphate,3'-diphosphate pyrophosphatase
MRYACVDIGSNTTRLLVAEPLRGGLREIAARRDFTAIAPGPIPPDRIAAVAAQVAEQVAAAQLAGAQRLRVVATAVVREAPNGPDLVAAVSAASRTQVDVLSAQDEARLAFAGAAQAAGGDPGAPLAVVDVGGGSCEVAVGTAAAGAQWCASVPAGSAALAARYFASDPCTPAELAAARAAARAAFAGLDVPEVRRAVAVGGSATSLRRLAGGRLDPPALEAAVAALAAAPQAEVARRYELAPERVRLLPAGILLLDAAAERIGRPLEIAEGGLREGVVLGLIAGSGP